MSYALPAGHRGNAHVTQTGGLRAIVARLRAHRRIAPDKTSHYSMQTITVNASTPNGIAVDQFDDLFIANGGDMAIDAPGGTSPFFDLYGTGQQMFSIAIGGSNINAFYPGGAFLGNGSYELRSGAVQYVDGPRESQVPVGSVCVLGAYWYDDLNAEALSFATIPGGSYSMPLPC